MKTDARPIGVFDSGIGGVTVLKELATQFPDEDFIYLGDTARLPYGSKSAQTIRRYTEQNLAWLLSHQVKAVVIACNTASTQMREKDFQEVPVYNVIDPGANKAVATTMNKKIGVLGTRATITSQAYQQAISQRDNKCTVINQACPLFVPLAEEGWDDDPVTNLIIFRYLNEIKSSDVDTLILGCTHYPILKKSIQKVMGQNVQLIDSGIAIAEQINADFKSGSLLRNKNNQGRIKIFTTDESQQFKTLALKILSPLKPDSFALTDL